MASAKSKSKAKPKPKQPRVPKAVLDALLDGLERGWDLESSPENEWAKKAAHKELARRYGSVPRERLTAIALRELRESVEDREHGSAAKIIALIEKMSSEPAPLDLQLQLGTLEECGQTRLRIAQAAAARAVNPGEAQTLLLAVTQAEAAIRAVKEEEAKEDCVPIEDIDDARKRVAEIVRRIKGRLWRC
jgi:hypothetical protein